MKNKYKMFFIVLLVSLTIVTSTVAIINESNIMHCVSCKEPECNICLLIHIANSYLKKLSILIIEIYLLFITVPLIQIVNGKNFKLQKQTLVELKVIQNN